MKKFVLLISACVSLFLGCVAEEISPVDEPGITFHIEAAVPFSSSTRTAPIYSSDALQNLANVVVYVFRSTDNGSSYKYYRTIDLSSEWTRGWSSVTHKLPKSEMFENGMYRFLAVGMDAATDYRVNPAQMVVGETDYSTVTATLTATAPEELFSGLTDYTIGSSIEVIRVLIHRRVAGVLGHFTNVPASIGGMPVRYLRLTLQGSNTLVDIASNPGNTAPLTAATAPAYNIFNVDLSGQQVQNGVYTGTQVGAGVQQLPNTTLVGAYIVPVAFTAGATMTLSLMGGGNGDVVLRSWSVRDDSGNTTFSILPNHFYSLGRKLKSATTTGDRADDPTDDDQPIDFQSQTLVVNLNSGWELTHQMTVPVDSPDTSAP